MSSGTSEEISSLEIQTEALKRLSREINLWIEIRGGGEEGRSTCQSSSPSLFWPSKGVAVQLAKGSLSPALQGASLSTAGSQAGELDRSFVVPVAWRKLS